MARRLLLSLPLALGALALGGGAALLMINLLLPLLGHPPMRLSPMLVGVTVPEKPRASWDSLLHGRYQAIYGRLIGTKMPLYNAAVRLRNQAEYSLFGVSAIPGLAIGPGPNLFELVYAEEYCSRNIAAWRPGAERWAARIREMQDEQERRGKLFLYVLTPSKVSQYPAILPRGYNCPSTAADRTGMVPAWLAILQAAGVHVVDTTAVMAAAHGAYPFVMYPQGGAHWNDVGAALSVQAVMAGLNRLAPGAGFVPFRFTWHMAPSGTGIDVDLANLTNLLKPFPNGPVPIVDVQPGPAPVPCPDTKVVIVGGSFGHALLQLLSRATCNPPSVEFEYWRAYTISWPTSGIQLENGADPARREAAILGADVLIYEENEQVMPNPVSGFALYDFLRDHQGKS